MPKISHVGDIIEHKQHGRGIILGCEHKRAYNANFYHVYFFKNKTFGYAASFDTVQTATDISRQQAQNILLESLQAKCGRFVIGDLVDHPKFGTGLILNNGVKRSDRIYYHVFYPKTQTFGYNATFSLIEAVTDKNLAKAKDILFNNVQIPAF